MNVYFVRHGYAYHNKLSEEIGDRAYFDERTEDAPLLEKGIEQANIAGKEISNIHFDYVFCSPSLRCIETLENLFDDKIRYIHLLDDLMEPQGEHICNKRKNIEELEEFCSKQRNNYNILNISKKYNFEIETYENFINRTKEFYNKILNLKTDSVQNILVISHHDWIKTFFKNLNIDYYPKNCEIKKIIL
jgi:broad specificity phosphatase PhoE